MKYLQVAAFLVGVSQQTELLAMLSETNDPNEWMYLMESGPAPADVEFVQYGDVTVTIAKRTGEDDD